MQSEIDVPTRLQWLSNEPTGRHIDFGAAVGSFVVHSRRIIAIKRFLANGEPTLMRSDHQWRVYDVENPVDDPTYNLPKRVRLVDDDITQPMFFFSIKDPVV